LIFELFYGVDELLPEVNEFSAHFGLQGAKKFILQDCGRWQMLARLSMRAM